MGEKNPIDEVQQRTPLGTLASVVGIILSLIYLLNPSAGFIELIPDNLPVVGNIDEAGATWLIIACLRYLGVDLSALFHRTPKPQLPAPDPNENDKR
ncbi:MAG: YkvA family protein [Planctomycetota bacterium]|jgi:uncharacterized membrane protein YkvA (DUF1232 family)